MSLNSHNPHSPAYYEHSGRLTAAGVILPVLAGSVMVLALSPFAGFFKWVGAYYIDLGFLGFLGIGLFMGQVAGKVVKKCKTRNERYCYWLGFLLGLLHVATAWLWFYVLLQLGDIKASTGLADGVYWPWEDIGRFFTVVHTYVFEEGKRGQLIFLTILSALFTKFFYVVIEFPNLSGTWLYGLWAVEAFLVVHLIAKTCEETAGKHGFVFCETCNRVSSVLFKSPLLKPLASSFAEQARIRAELERGRLSPLEKLTPAGELAPNGEINEPGEYARLILRGCKVCKNFYCVDIAKVNVKWDDFDVRLRELIEEDDEDSLVVEHLLIKPAWYERLKAHWSDDSAK